MLSDVKLPGRIPSGMGPAIESFTGVRIQGVCRPERRLTRQVGISNDFQRLKRDEMSETGIQSFWDVGIHQ